MDIIIKPVTSHKEIQDCLKIRDIVFVQGQNVPQHLEVDGKDDQCQHYLLLLDHEPVGTARVQFKDDYAKIERFAILDKYQGRGLGRQLLAKIIETLQNTAATKAKLSAQTYAIPFYQKFGFTICSEEYMDAAIPHKDMQLDL